MCWKFQKLGQSSTPWPVFELLELEIWAVCCLAHHGLLLSASQSTNLTSFARKFKRPVTVSYVPSSYDFFWKFWYYFLFFFLVGSFILNINFIYVFSLNVIFPFYVNNKIPLFTQKKSLSYCLKESWSGKISQSIHKDVNFPKNLCDFYDKIKIIIYIEKT